MPALEQACGCPAALIIRTALRIHHSVLSNSLKISNFGPCPMFTGQLLCKMAVLVPEPSQASDLTSIHTAYATAQGLSSLHHSNVGNCERSNVENCLQFRK